MKKAILFLILILLLGGLASAWADNGAVEGYIERFAYNGFKRYIVVNGKKYLVTRKSRIEVLRGKELLVKNTRGYLKVGTKIQAWISSIDGEPWAKIIKLEASAPEPLKKSGSMKVPVVKP